MQRKAIDFEKDGIKFLGQKKMPLTKWLEIADNPIQRETEYRAKKARHLLKLHPSHLVVAAAKVNGKLYKVDGHTRSYIWENTLTGDNAPQCDSLPGQVLVNVFDVANEDAAKALFDVYDQPASVKGSADVVFGALRDNNIQFQTAWLAHGNFKYAVQNATNMLSPNLRKHGGGSADARENVVRWAPELTKLDKISPHRQSFAVSVLVPCLWSYTVFPEERISAFWHSVQSDGGFKREGERDIVQATVEYILQCRLEGKFAANFLPEMTRTIFSYAQKYNKNPNHMSKNFRILGSREYQAWREEIAKAKGLHKILGWQ